MLSVVWECVPEQNRTSYLHGNWSLFIVHTVEATQVISCLEPLMCSESWRHSKRLPIELPASLFIN